MDENFPFRANSRKFFFDRLNSSTPKNLSHIFDEDLDPLPRLRYPPSTLKQRGHPSSTSSYLPTEESSSVIIYSRDIRMDLALAKQVVVYQGRDTGAMILALEIRSGNTEAKVILYKAQHQVITTLKLLPHGGTVHMRDSYVEFYDDTCDFWSLRFTREEHELDFVRKMLDFNLPIKLHRGESEDLHPLQARVDHGKNMDKRKPYRVHTDHRNHNGDHRDYNGDHRNHNGDHRAHNGDHREQRKDACGNNIRQRHHRDPDEPHPVAPQQTPATTMEIQPHSSEDPSPRCRQYMECLFSHFAILGCDCRNCERLRRQLYGDLIPEEDEIVTPMPRPFVSSTNSTETFDDPLAHLEYRTYIVDEEARTYIVDDMSSEYLGRDPSSDVTPFTPRLDRETTGNRTDEDSSMSSSSARLIRRYLDYHGATEMERKIESILGNLQRRLGTSSSGEHEPRNGNTKGSGSGCENCDRYIREIQLLKKQVADRDRIIRQLDM